MSETCGSSASQVARWSYPPLADEADEAGNWPRRTNRAFLRHATTSSGGAVPTWTSLVVVVIVVLSR